MIVSMLDLEDGTSSDDTTTTEVIKPTPEHEEAPDPEPVADEPIDGKQEAPNPESTDIDQEVPDVEDFDTSVIDEGEFNALSTTEDPDVDDEKFNGLAAAVENAKTIANNGASTDTALAAFSKVDSIYFGLTSAEQEEALSIWVDFLEFYKENPYVKAVIHETHEYFSSANTAIEAANGKTVSLLSDVNGLTVSNKSNLRLDLNGYSVSGLSIKPALAITNSSNVTVLAKAYPKAYPNPIPPASSTSISEANLTTADKAAGIYVKNSTGVKVYDIPVLKNNGSTVGGIGIDGTGGTASVELNNMNISSNSGAKAGGVCCWTGTGSGTSSVTLNNCKVASNSGSAYAGGIAAIGNATVTLKGNSIVQSNNGPLAGGLFAQGSGAQRALSSASFTLSGTTIQGNWSTTSSEIGAGGIYLDTGTAIKSADNSSINSNTAAYGVGGIYAKDAEINIGHSSIKKNTGTIAGGIYIEGSSTGCSIYRTSIDENVAKSEDGGGAILMTSPDDLDMTYGSIIKNTGYSKNGVMPESVGLALVAKGVDIRNNISTSKDAINEEPASSGNEIPSNASTGSGSTVTNKPKIPTPNTPNTIGHNDYLNHEAPLIEDPYAIMEIDQVQESDGLAAQANIDQDESTITTGTFDSNESGFGNFGWTIVVIVLAIVAIALCLLALGMRGKLSYRNK